MPFSEQQLKPVKMSFDKEQGETNCLRSYLREHQVHWILNAGFSYWLKKLVSWRIQSTYRIKYLGNPPNSQQQWPLCYGGIWTLLEKMSHHSLNSSVFKGKKLHIPPCLSARVHRMASPSCYVHRCNLRLLKAIELEAKKWKNGKAHKLSINIPIIRIWDFSVYISKQAFSHWCFQSLIAWVKRLRSAGSP